MKKELLSSEIEEIKNNEYVVFSTTNNNIPHSIVVMPSRIESNRIIISNIQMNKTIENIIINPNGFINVYIKENNDKQYKIDCICEVFNSGELFDDIKCYEETNNLPEELKVKQIIIANIKDIEISEG